jgi:hypothetical protein
MAGRLSACRSHQPQRQLTVITVLVLFKEAFQTDRRLGHLETAAPPDFLGNIFGDIAGPTFTGVEGDDANRIGVLTLKQVRNDGFKVCGGLGVGLSPATAEITEIIEHQIHGFTVTSRDNGRGSITHDATPCNGPKIASDRPDCESTVRKISNVCVSGETCLHPRFSGSAREGPIAN